MSASRISRLFSELERTVLPPPSTQQFSIYRPPVAAGISVAEVLPSCASESGEPVGEDDLVGQAEVQLSRLKRLSLRFPELERERADIARIEQQLSSVLSQLKEIAMRKRELVGGDVRLQALSDRVSASTRVLEQQLYRRQHELEELRQERDIHHGKVAGLEAELHRLKSSVAELTESDGQLATLVQSLVEQTSYESDTLYDLDLQFLDLQSVLKSLLLATPSRSTRKISRMERLRQDAMASDPFLAELAASSAAEATLHNDLLAEQDALQSQLQSIRSEIQSREEDLAVHLERDPERRQLQHELQQVEERRNSVAANRSFILNCGVRLLAVASQAESPEALLLGLLKANGGEMSLADCKADFAELLDDRRGSRVLQCIYACVAASLVKIDRSEVANTVVLLAPF